MAAPRTPMPRMAMNATRTSIPAKRDREEIGESKQTVAREGKADKEPVGMSDIRSMYAKKDKRK